jgi:hypothetical protein
MYCHHRILGPLRNGVRVRRGLAPRKRRSVRSKNSRPNVNCAQEIDRYVKSLDPGGSRCAAVSQAAGEIPKPVVDRSLTERETRRELGKWAPLMTLEEFNCQPRTPQVFSLKPRFRIGHIRRLRARTRSRRVAGRYRHPGTSAREAKGRDPRS